MKRKYLITMLLAVALCLLFTVGVCAAATNDFGTPEVISNIDLTNMNADTSARVVIVDANGEYHTYPAQYVVSNNTKFYYDFKPINNALGTSYTKNSVVRIEVPDNILIATNCGDLCSAGALVEIKFSENSQCHTLEYGCFYNNKKLEKVSIPASVTTLGTLIINNSTLKELVFMDGFSAVLPSNSFSGALGVEKVIFSNQMTTVEDRALNSTLGTSLKEFYFGANLKDLGTNNMAWVKQSVKFYIPDGFLDDAESISMETFSWWDSSECLPTGVIFYTGSENQMRALMEKSTYNRVICPNANLVEWDSSKSDDEYVPTSGWTIVYNYNKCKAFYNNEHEEKILNSCQFGCGRGCGAVEILENPVHEYVKSFKNGESEQLNYFAVITMYETCVNCKSQNGAPKDIAPIFTDKGYSKSMDDVLGIVYSYSIDRAALAEYSLNAQTEIEYGIVVSVTEGTPLTLEDDKIKAGSGAVTVDFSRISVANVKIKVMGFKEQTLDTAIVCCGYVRQGDTIYYLSDGLSNLNASGKTYNSIANE